MGSAASLVAACEDSYVVDAYSLVRQATTKGADLAVTRAQIERIPYASMAARLGDGPQAMLILGRYDGAELNWISAEKEVVVTRRGRVVKTFGLPQDVKETVFLTDDPVGAPASDTAPLGACVRTLDLEPLHRDGIVVRSQFTRVGADPVDILGTHIATERWDEACEAPELQWSFVNSYWIEPATGFVWKSRQALAPKLASLELVVFKPAA